MRDVTAAEPSRIALLLVGLFHFVSRLDVFTADIEDMRTPRRQAELDEVVEHLARFQPNRVLIERPFGDPATAATYAAWRRGQRILAPDEREQLGFRLAARLGLENIAGIDIVHRWYESGLDALIARERRLRTIWQELESHGRDQTAEFEARVRESTVGEVLRWMNEPEVRARNLHVYLQRYARFVSGDEYAGADMVGNWYHRNVRIYANLLRSVDEGDRVVVLYGAGHVPVLEHLLTASGLFTLLDPLHYLPGARGTRGAG